MIELRGDEALAVFSSPRQALRAAVELQARFVEETSADPSLPLRVGIGLDAGEAVPLEGGYRGGPLNVAARLCALAAPGEVLASPEVVHLARRVEGLRFLGQGPVRLKGLSQPLQVIKVVVELANPYKGLRPFEEADAPDFFGREALTEEIVARLWETGERSRFLAIVGPSGSGKSSVVRAGLIPALRQGALPGVTRCLVAVMLPGQQPMKELAAAIEQVAFGEPHGLEGLQQGQSGLLSLVEQILPPGDSELVLVIDQFEELFTLVEDEALRAQFLETLRAAVLGPAGRLRVVVTLRADFYDRPLLYKAFGDLVGARTQTVTSLSAEELERAISGPAEGAGVALEPGLMAQIVADVSDEAGALPLLQYALTELFEQRRGNAMTLEAYRAIGGVSGALVRRAESVYGDLDDVQKEAARQLFLRLTASVDETEVTRRRVLRPELLSLQADATAMETAIEAFGSVRLLSFDRDPVTGSPTVEVAHEALLSEWARLRGWLEAASEDLRTQHRLAASAREWFDAGREPSFLVAGSRLEHFEGWREDSGLGITPEEREFLEASLAERDRRRAEGEARQARERALERRSFRRLRALVAVLAAAALIAGGLTVFAFNQRERAEWEGRVAIARELAAAAVANLEVDPERSILLALEAVELTRSVDGSVLPEAEEALHRAVLASRIVLSVPGVGGALDWSPDGTMFVTEGPEETGLVDIRNAETGESLRSFHGHDVDVNFVAFSSDGSMLATTGDDGAARVWDPESGEELWSLQGLDGPVVGPSFSPDGSLLAASWLDEGMVRVWDLATGRTVREIGSLQEPFRTSFSPGGKRMAISSFEPPVAVVVDVSSGQEVFKLQGHKAPVLDVNWSPDGRWIASSSVDSSVRIWEAETGNLRFTLFGHTGPVDDADWSPDSTRLVTGSADGTAKVWEITEGGTRELLSLSAQGTRPGINGVTFSPDGDRVMTGDVEIGTVKVWDVSPTGGAEWVNLPADPAWLASVVFTPDGRRLVASSGDGSVTVWGPETGRRILTIGAHGSPADPSGAVVFAIDVSPDGKLIATAGSDQSAKVWDAATGEEVFTVRSSGMVDDVAWSPDGELLATAASDEGLARIVDRSGKEVTVLREEPGFWIVALRFSPDGRLLATARVPSGRPDPTAQQVKIWDWERGKVVRTISTPTENVAFDPDGARIATEHGGLAEIWDAESGKKVATLAGHEGGLFDIAFSPDGTVIGTASADSTVRLWDAESGVQLLVLRGHEGPVGDVAFSPDGSKLASGAGDGTVRVWALDLDDLIEIANRELTRTLTDEECRQYLHVDRCPQA